MVASILGDGLNRSGKMCGHRKAVLESHRDFIIGRINETPHLMLHGLKDELAARGLTVSHNAAGRWRDT